MIACLEKFLFLLPAFIQPVDFPPNYMDIDVTFGCISLYVLLSMTNRPLCFFLFFLFCLFLQLIILQWWCL